MLIDKTQVINQYQPASPISGKYLHTPADPDENGIFRPTFTQINVDSDTESSKFKEFEDFIIYDGGGVV